MIAWLLLVLRTLRGMARSRILSEDHLRRTVSTYITYYNGGRPHQGIEGIPRLTEGLSSSDRGRPDQVRGAPGARRPSPRLPTRRVARAHAKSLKAGPIGSGRSWSCTQCRILTWTGHNVFPSVDA